MPYSVTNRSVSGKTKLRISQGCNCSRDNGKGRGICSIPKWRRKCISAISNSLPAEKGEEGRERLQKDKQQVQGSSFPFIAGSELTGSASKNVTQLGHFECYCWDMRESAVLLATDTASRYPPSQAEEVWLGSENQQKELAFVLFLRASNLWRSLLLTELKRKVQERKEGKPQA